MTQSKRQRRSKYAKIPKKSKILFLKKVIQEKEPLKITADLYKINYSTAKTLIRQYKCDMLEINLSECQNTESEYNSSRIQQLKRCNYKSISKLEGQVQSPVIRFSNGQNLLSNGNYEQRRGFILTWPKQFNSSKPIQVISKIQFL